MGWASLFPNSKRSIAFLYTIKSHLLHMDHPLDIQCHPLQIVCNPFEEEGEGELVGEVVVEMVGEVVVEMVRELVVYLSRHCLLPYPPYTYPSLDTCILPQTYPSPDTFIPLPTYTSPSIPPHTCTYLPSPMSPEPAFMVVDITLSSHPLSFLTLPLIDETIVDLVSELGALPTRRPRAPHILRVLHPSAPLAPSAPFEIARDPICNTPNYTIVVYYMFRV